MLKSLKKKAQDKIQQEIEKIDADDIKNGTAILTKVVLENGVEVIKGGVGSIITSVLIKITLFVVVIAVIFIGSCTTINHLITNENQEVRI